MSTVILADFFETLGRHLEEYLLSAAREHVSAARSDAEAFLAAAQADLKRWVSALAAGQLERRRIHLARARSGGTL